MAECPHCNKALEGFVSRESLKTQLAEVTTAKDAALRELKSEVVELRTKAGSYDAVVAERDGLVQANQAREQADTRRAALAEAGADAGLLASFELHYNASQAGAAEDAKQDFAAWLAAAKEDPFMAAHFGTPSAPPAGAPPAVKPPMGPPPANPDTGAHQPGAPVVMSPAELQQFFQSPAFKALAPEQRQAKTAELEAQLLAPQDRRFP